MVKLALVSALSIMVVAILFFWMVAAITPDEPSKSTPRKPPYTAVLQRGPPALVREEPSCEQMIESHRQEIEGYRACSDVSECFHVRSGWLPMLSANRQFSRRVEARVAALAETCGKRQSHDVFYSDYGIDILCDDQRCTVSEVTAEGMRNRLNAASKRVLHGVN